MHISDERRRGPRDARAWWAYFGSFGDDIFDDAAWADDDAETDCATPGGR